jgi:antitoxin (DNA-binding transcriptional repressor) of toxin-antitoxin stability system
MQIDPGVLLQWGRGETVVVSYHGRPVAEIRPVEATSSDETLEARLSRLADAGVLVRTEARSGALQRVARRRGALARFLADRNE